MNFVDWCVKNLHARLATLARSNQAFNPIWAGAL